MFGQRFGIELELGGMRPDQFCQERGLLRGSGGPIRPDPLGTAIHWQCKTDNSVPDGLELCTRPITEEQLPFLKDDIKLLYSMGLRSRPTAGLHIHVGYPRSAFEPIRSLAFENWETILPRVERSFNPGASRLEYCRLRFRETAMEWNRYVAMNTTFSHHQTVEFRLFDSHLSYRYILRAIRFSCAFVKVLKLGKRLDPLSPGESLEAYLTKMAGGMTMEKLVT